MRVLRCASLIAACACARTAQAGEIAWDAPSDACPDAAGFSALVAEMSGGQVIGVPVSARAWQADDGWHVRVAARVEEQSFAREIQAPTCAEVARAAALVVALLGREAASAEPPASPDTPAAGVVATPQVAARAVRPEPPARVDVRLDAGAAMGTLPGVAPRFAFAVGARAGRFRFEAGGEWRFDARATGVDGTGADFTLLAGDLRACLAPDRWRACGGFALGRLHGQGFGTSQDEARDSLWAALTASLGYRWNLGSRFGILAEAELAVPAARPAFKVEGVEVHAVAAVDVRLALGLVTTIF